MTQSLIRTDNETLPSDCVMTLKDITDLIAVQHSKAMVKVEELQGEEGFGGLSKMDTPTFNPDGSINKTIKTYALTKKQSIAAAARLNNQMLMKVIDRLEELEKPLTEIEMAKKYLANLEALEASKALTETLKITLDKAEEWSSIKRQEAIHHKKFDWGRLKRVSSELGVEIKKVFDANYGEVNSYHSSVWLEVYGVDMARGAV